MVTHAGSGVFLGGPPRHTPSHRSRGLNVPKILGPPICAHTVWETVAKYCMVIKVNERNIFTVSTTLGARPKIFVTQMLTRDLFAVADLPVNFNSVISKWAQREASRYVCAVHLTAVSSWKSHHHRRHDVTTDIITSSSKSKTSPIQRHATHTLPSSQLPAAISDGQIRITIQM